MALSKEYILPPKLRRRKKATESVQERSPLEALQRRINRLESALVSIMHLHSSMATSLDTVLSDMRRDACYLSPETCVDAKELQQKLRQALYTPRKAT